MSNHGHFLATKHPGQVGEGEAGRGKAAPAAYYRFFGLISKHPGQVGEGNEKSGAGGPGISCAVG
jgi:hypothetical protein